MAQSFVKRRKKMGYVGLRVVSVKGDAQTTGVVHDVDLPSTQVIVNVFCSRMSERYDSGERRSIIWREQFDIELLEPFETSPH